MSLVTRIRYIVTMIALCVIVCCCSMNNNKQSNHGMVGLPVRFKTASQNNTIRMSDLFCKVKYIPLENSDNASLINRVDDLRFTNDGIYICDKSNASILRFDLGGKFVHRYQHRGRGPGEYINIYQFDVNETTGNISIYDGSSNRVLVYSSSDIFLYDFQIDDVPRDFAQLPNGDFLFYTHDYMRGVRRGLWQTDSVGRFKQQVITIDEDFLFNSGFHSKYLRHYGDTVVLAGPEDKNLIYHIACDTTSAPYILDVDITIPRKLQKNPLGASDKYRGKYYTIFNCYETEHLLTVSLHDTYQHIAIYHHKTTGVTYQPMKSDDITDDMPPIGLFAASTPEAIITVLSAEYILSFEQLTEMFPQINEESNPIIAIAYTQ